MKIVAPAGNKERLYAAIKAGAEEIYMGLKGFGARRAAENFSLEEFLEALDYAHLRGSRIFLTLNTIMMKEEIEFLYPNLKRLYEHGLDAVIVQDLGLAYYLKQNFPDLELHGSTQLSVANHIEINYLKEIGFSRVVLPRELSFEEIKRIRENTEIELEVFVSGALCISYSGNCYLSSFLGGRSGNRGMCAQPCRKKYETQEGEKSYFLSPKDQFFGKEEIEKLKEIGIDSIKIEGRMKEPNYVFTTVQYYRNLIAGEEIQERSSALFNRGYSKGYFYENSKEIMNPKFSSNLGEKIGILRGKELRLEKEIILGDGLSYLSASYEKLGGAYLNQIQILGVQEKRKKAYPGEILVCKDLPRGSKYVYRNFGKELQDQLEQEKQKTEKRKEIQVFVRAKVGEALVLRFSSKNEWKQEISIEVTSSELLERAKQRESSAEELLEKLAELGNTSFALASWDLQLEKGIFVPLSMLKHLKRQAIEKLEQALLCSYRRIAGEEWKLSLPENTKKERLDFIFVVSKQEQKQFLEQHGYSSVFLRSYEIAKEGELEKHDITNPFCANLYQILKHQRKETLVANWNLNISNAYTAKVLETFTNLGVLMLSPEMSFEKMKKFGEIPQKKALLVYSKLRGMYIELDLSGAEENRLFNQEGDCFQVKKNDLGHTEVYLSEPLNILSEQDRIQKLGIEIAVLEFTEETLQEIEEILKQLEQKQGNYRAYNYERGVY